MDTVGKQESEASGEGSINIHTLSGVGWTAGEKSAVWQREAGPAHDHLEGWAGAKGGRRGRKGMYVESWLICVIILQKPTHGKKKQLI